MKTVLEALFNAAGLLPSASVFFSLQFPNSRCFHPNTGQLDV